MKNKNKTIRDSKGRFVKGIFPHNKGKTKENYNPLKKISKKLTGKHLSPKTEFQKGHKKLRTNESYKKQGEKFKKERLDEGNPMYGKTQSKKWREQHSKDMKKWYETNISPVLGKHPWNYNLTKEIDDRLKPSKSWLEMRKNLVLPKKDSKPEKIIQNFLKQLNIEFYTHYWMNIEHNYQCDILIPSMNLVIECDGNYWHKYPIGTEKDIARNQELLKAGYKVLRLWESEIKVITLPEFENKLIQVAQ